jgi:hypothetical protein
VPVELVNHCQGVAFAEFALRWILEPSIISQPPLYVCTWLQNRADEICSPSRNYEKRGRTDLEDIGDGDGVLGGLALGGDDGDGRP